MHLYKTEGKGSLPLFQQNQNLNNPALYRPSKPLADAVNVALMMGQPLLLTGEPGTGKTQLAFHIAHFFGMDAPLVFNVQTSSTASELFYKYDALAHFQYNQNNKVQLTPADLEARFIHYNALGEAIKLKKRVVVLIDEIDKAPRDLPNDVLYALENLCFKVPEINKYYESQSEYKPIIIMTSNSEKNLPDAFMRRVVYFHIPFPSPEDLLAILNAKTSGLNKEELSTIIKHFMKIRGLKFRKLPSTAELIYWVFFLQKLDFPFHKLSGGLNMDDREKLLMSYSILAKNKEDHDILTKNI